MTHQEVFNYFEERFYEAIRKYGFNQFELNPGYVETKEDLILFVESIANSLFDGIEFSFADNDEIDEAVDFTFKNRQVTLRIDPKYGHIELGFSKVIDLLMELTGKFVTMAQPVNLLVSGDEKDMRAAWSEGFPIKLPEIDFFNGNANGKWFKKQERRNSFILNELIDIDCYHEFILKGLNIFLAEKGEKLRYSDRQIRFYYMGSLLHVCINGKSVQCFTTNDNTTIFRNNFVNQIFLLNYWSVDSGTSLKYTSNADSETQVTIPFEAFISNFGRDR